MSSAFFFTFDCTDPEKQKLIKSNQVFIANVKKTKIFTTQKLVFSLKEKKYVPKHQHPQKSIKNVNQNFQILQNQKETLMVPLTTKKRFRIFKQIQQTINPNSSKPQNAISSTKSSIIRFSILDSQQGSFQKDNLHSTQETQLCGAQSTLYESQRNHQRITWKKEGGKSYSINQNSSKSASGLWKSVNLNKVLMNKQNKDPQLLKNRSEANLFKLYQEQKRPFLSMLQRDRAAFKQIEQQQIPSTFEQYSFQKQPSSTKPESIGKIKIDDKKKKFDQMEIRSICSIKEQSSGDDMSQVIVGSRLTLGKKQYSLAERLFNDFP